MSDLISTIEKSKSSNELGLYFVDDHLTIPEEIYQLKHLRKLIISNCQFKHFPKGIASLSQLEELSIKATPLNNLPQDLFELSNLTQLTISSDNQQLKIPSGLLKLKKLKIIFLNNCKLDLSSIDFSECKSLTRVFLKNCQLTALPKGLDQLDIEYLDLINNKISTLPPSISHWKNITTLIVSQNQLIELPDIFDQFPILRRLEVNKNLLTQLPPSMKKLKKLTHLYIEKNRFKSPPLEVLFMDDIFNILGQDIPYYSQFNYRYNFRDYYPKIRAANSPDKYRISLYHILGENDKKVAKIPLEHLLEALRVKYQPLQISAIQYLSKRAKKSIKSQPITKQSVLVILGKIAFKKSEIKRRLKELGLKYSTKIKATTSHVVVGLNLAEIAPLLDPKLVIITDKELNKFMEQNEDQYLLNKSENIQDQKDNISQLLSSTDVDNVEIAFEILKTSGIPKELITELFLVFKNTNLPQKLRKAAKGMIMIHGSEELCQKLPLRRLLFNKHMDPHIRHYNIELYTKDTELDSQKVKTYIKQWI